MVLSLAAFAFRIIFYDYRIGGGIFLGLCCLAVIWMICAALLTISPVVVYSGGITKRLLGMITCAMRWDDVGAVYKLRQRKLYGSFLGSRAYADTYILRRKDWSLIYVLLPNLIRSIQFNDQFANVSTLLRIVNKQSEQHGFPLLLTDFEMRARDPSAK